MSDLISRADAIEALGEEPPVWYDGEDEIAERNQWRRDKAAIESLPSAEPKTKIGKWIAKSERYRWMRKCSVCGWMQEIDTPKMQGWVYRYCPNCGSKMMTKGGESE